MTISQRQHQNIAVKFWISSPLIMELKIFQLALFLMCLKLYHEGLSFQLIFHHFNLHGKTFSIKISSFCNNMYHSLFLQKTIPLTPKYHSFLGLFSSSVVKFYEARYLENENGRPAVVTEFISGDPVGMVPLNNFVFGTNPRYFYIYQQNEQRQIAHFLLEYQAFPGDADYSPRPHKPCPK